MDALKTGTSLSYLRTAKATGGIRIGTRDEGYILGALSGLEERLKERDIETSATGQVVSFRKSYEQKYDPDDVLSDEDAEELHRKADTWLHLIEDDLGREQRIPVENIGLLDVSRLIENPEDIFEKHIWNWLDDRPKEDIIEASRALVVGCSTASVMLSLRAVEYCLRVWHEDEHESLEAAWGRVLDRLIEEYTTEEHSNDTVLTQLSTVPPVMSNLVYLKEKRNEVNHPEKSPDSYEAQRTLMIVASTITDIYHEMNEERIESIKESNTIELAEIGEFNVPDYDEEADVEDFFIETIVELDKEYEGGVPRTAIYELGENIGFAEDEVKNIIRNLLMEGLAYEASEEHIVPI